MFSSSSYAGWLAVADNSIANFYMDLERIRKLDGYVYFWRLTDLKKPSPQAQGYLSFKQYVQGDCKLFRRKSLSSSAHNEPMGGGLGYMVNKPDKEWKYPAPNSANESILKLACNR